MVVSHNLLFWVIPSPSVSQVLWYIVITHFFTHYILLLSLLNAWYINNTGWMDVIPCDSQPWSRCFVLICRESLFLLTYLLFLVNTVVGLIAGIWRMVITALYNIIHLGRIDISLLHRTAESFDPGMIWLILRTAEYGTSLGDSPEAVKIWTKIIHINWKTQGIIRFCLWTWIRF